MGSQEEQTVLARNPARAGGTLDWVQGRACGGPGRTRWGCSGTFSYGRTEGPGWKDGVGGPNCEWLAEDANQNAAGRAWLLVRGRGWLRSGPEIGANSDPGAKRARVLPEAGRAQEGVPGLGDCAAVHLTTLSLCRATLETCTQEMDGAGRGPVLLHSDPQAPPQGHTVP